MRCVRSIRMFTLTAALVICHASAQGGPRTSQEVGASGDAESKPAEAQLPPQVDMLYHWEGPKSVPASKLLTGTENKYTLRARRNSLEWIRKVVRANWLPSDPRTLDDGLLMVKDEFGPIDATHVQWEKNDYLIRVGQTKTVLTVVLVPLEQQGTEGGDRTLETRKKKAKDLCRDVLVDQVAVEVVGPTNSRPTTRNIKSELLRASFETASVAPVGDAVQGKCAAPDAEVASDRRDFGYWWRRVSWYLDGAQLLIYTLKTEGGAWRADYGSLLDENWFK